MKKKLFSKAYGMHILLNQKRTMLLVLLVVCMLFHSVSSVSAAAAQPTYFNTLHKVHGKLYYFNAKGNPIKNKWKTINGKRYYFQADGAAASGQIKIGKDTFRFSDRCVLEKKINTRSLAPLRKRLVSMCKTYPDTWSVYVKNLDTGKSITINNRSMYAASLVKLYAAAAAYDKIEKGKLSEKSIRDEMNLMITESDNWCYNFIVHKIGKNTVNSWLKKNHYTDTNQGTGIGGTGNSDGLYNGSGSNVTSVADCGKFMESVYRGTCVSKSASAKLLRLLKHQTRRWKIPAGIPSSVTVANKTGETSDYCHDTAIVYSEGADYIICIMANVPGDAWYDDRYIPRLSAQVYRFFNS